MTTDGVTGRLHGAMQWLLRSLCTICACMAFCELSAPTCRQSPSKMAAKLSFVGFSLKSSPVLCVVQIQSQKAPMFQPLDTVACLEGVELPQIAPPPNSFSSKPQATMSDLAGAGPHRCISLLAF